MTVLVTGASGFLGSHIAEQLSKQGRRVRALVRKTSNTAFLRTLEGVELAEGSVEDFESVLKATQGVEAVVHGAALLYARRPEDFRRVNIGGTENLLLAARRSNGGMRRFVLVSSLSAAGPSDDAGRPVPDDILPHPVTEYGRSKLAAERAALAFKDELPVTVLRPPLIYGPRDRETLIFYKSIRNGVLPLVSPLENKFSAVYAADCARACIRALDADSPTGCTFCLEDGVAHTFRDLILQVEAALGRRAWIRIPLPRPVVRCAAAATELYGMLTNRAVIFTRDKCNELFNQWVCDGTRARQTLGWEPEVPFERGVRLTADWYKSAGWL
ncbi:MAG TPA: NAD-dependent epimerase/dehydratase family protein [Polyangiaceae bacterium]|jgi:nucleoside-diphosphate-sugar epimerase